MNKLDIKDKKILYELDQCSMQTNKQIAKKVGLSEMVVGNRIKNLLENKIIDKFFIKTNASVLKLNHIKIYFRLQNLTQSKEKELLKKLKRQKGILWIGSCRGKYDLVVSLQIKNIKKFSKKYEELFNDWQEYIWNKTVIISESATSFTKAYLLENKKSKEITYSEKNQKKASLDSTDKKILKILSRNSRETYVNMGSKVNLSADAINYRIKNLIKNNIISGSGVKINFEKIGNNYYILPLKFQNLNSKQILNLKNFALNNKNTIIFIKTIGEHDFELEVETQTKKELDSLLENLKKYFIKDLKDYEIIEITKEHLLNYFNF